MLKYFESNSEYQTEDFADADIQINHLYEYVSNTLLNGFINYSKPIAVCLLERYSWYSQENVDKMLEGYHTDLGTYDDDIIILSKSKSGQTYTFFWFDCDVSDCQIGFFRTTDKEDIVKQEFSSWCYNLIKMDTTYAKVKYGNDKPDIITDVRFIDANKLKGWISF